MISSIEGVLTARGDDWLEMTIGGVGVRASVPAATVARVGQIGVVARLYTHMQVRDESVTLYGFASQEERSMFLALLGVSGIGPRLGLVILSAFAPTQLVQAIEDGDSAALTKAPGVGKRGASRIIVELKGKLDELDVAALTGARPAQAEDPDLTAALLALGYTVQEIRTALTQQGAPSPDDAPLSERIRRTLNTMASQ